jgi:hypothetical protein
MIERLAGEAYASGFRGMFYLNAALAALGCLLAFWLIPQIGLERPDDSAMREKPEDGSNKSG